MLDLKPSRKPALPGGMTFYCTNALLAAPDALLLIFTEHTSG
jgi:hypothetical protein